MRRSDRATMVAFAVAVLVGGLNFVAVRFSNRELPPFEGAALRFAAASLLFLAYVRLRGITLPRGSSLIGAVLFGLLGFSGAYAFLYWGLVSAPAGMGSVALALVPVATPLLAAAHGLERLRARSLIGGALAAAGIAVVLSGQLATTLPLASVVALLLAAVAAAESGVVIKYFPRSHPAATNGVAMGIGAAALVLISWIAGEVWIVPSQPVTLIAYGYIVLSTIVLFAMVLYILARWSASSASLIFPIQPLVTVVAAAILAGEGIALPFVIGAVIVLVGVLIASGVQLGAGERRLADQTS
ncbi:MAG TPA: DMT family transporter [Candidatus Saccharimonadales bacterium]|jgi:drug/metabolite transporter (DMT)-like permease|nr:DMT family transporter [Candidatus Saccharimonadales bacterium]